ncbi:response regulator [Tropicimonas marinistellae]|uniref:response regulator n=1 Tax=Tropicimonas marinistellae TaxID=1739787 RepID=UPI0008364D17|nr:response regulator [Tropicimonas marinistellae]
MKALVVQDDPNVQSLWAQSLKAAGHETCVADTETAALDALKSTGFDLVLLDLCLNGQNALGVATLATYRNPRCKVVVVTGSAVYSQRKLFAMSPAVAAALRKPVDIESILAVCERVGRRERSTPPPVVAHSAVEFRP